MSDCCLLWKSVYLVCEVLHDGRSPALWYRELLVRNERAIPHLKLLAALLRSFKLRFSGSDADVQQSDMRASDHVALATPGIKRIAILLQVLDLSETMSGADFSQLRVLPDNVQRKILRLAQEGNETAIGPGTTGNLEVDSVSRADEKDGLEKLLREGYVVLDKVLGFSEGYLKEARQECEESLNESSKPGGLGGNSDKWTSNQVRGDKIKWLNVQDEEAAGRKKLVAVMKHLDGLRDRLEDLGYVVDGKSSFQLACYPGNGTRYGRHRDRSDSSPTRVITAICYLNPGWETQDGGQLCLFPDGTSSTGLDSCQMISPGLGRIVVFRSDMEHEVLPTFTHRYAVTVWYKQKSVVPSTPQPYCGKRGGFDPFPKARGMKKIFVSIASYRDGECQWTLASLFKNADKPDLVHVGIVWQYKPDSDAGFVRLAGDQKWIDHIREIRLPHHEASGPCKARSMVETLWNGEEYWLQIDAHMRFVSGWDTKLMGMLETAEEMSSFGKAILSSYPSGYESQGPAAAVFEQQLPLHLCAQRFDEEGMLRIVGKHLGKSFSNPVPSLFWAAGFSFSRSTLHFEVHYIDLPHLFFGEELFMLARMWTAGWDVFTPNETVLFHQWSRTNRSTIWGDDLIDREARGKSQNVVKEFLEGRSSQLFLDSLPVRTSIIRKRTMQEFYEHCGVDFKKKVLLNKSLWGGLHQDDFVENDESVECR